MKKIAVILGVVSAAFLATSIATAEAPAKGLYKAEVKGSLVVGKTGEITLNIFPGKGYKWNKEYPSKLELTSGDKVQFTKTSYKKVKGEILGTDKSGQVKIDAKGVSAGTHKVEATMSFSICSPETCHVLRKRKLDLSVVVK